MKTDNCSGDQIFLRDASCASDMEEEVISSPVRPNEAKPFFFIEIHNCSRLQS